MNNYYTPLSFNAMLAVCVGFRAVARFVFFFFIFCVGAIIQSFFSFVENIFQKYLVCIVIVFTFALQIQKHIQ